jgi:hypothetical protein
MSSRHAMLSPMDQAVRQPYAEWALQLCRAAADVCNYCDHVDHNETVDREWIFGSARALRELACQMAVHDGEDLLALYVARLREIEARNPLRAPDAIDGGALAERATTWRELQLAQVAHDRHYHPDVLGLSKFDQLNHYALHLAKLSGALAEVAQGLADPADFRRRRLPDLLLFGIKLATVTGKALPEKALAEGGDIARSPLVAA